MEHDRKTIKMPLYEGDEYNLTGNLRDTIGWLQEIIDGVPEELRDSVSMNIEDDSDGYGWVGVKVEIWYDRPETDEEYKARKDRISRALEEQQRQHVMAELALYQRLKSKYGLGGLAGDSQQPKDDV